MTAGRAGPGLSRLQVPRPGIYGPAWRYERVSGRFRASLGRWPGQHLHLFRLFPGVSGYRERISIMIRTDTMCSGVLVRPGARAVCTLCHGPLTVRLIQVLDYDPERCRVKWACAREANSRLKAPAASTPRWYRLPGRNKMARADLGSGLGPSDLY